MKAVVSRLKGVINPEPVTKLEGFAGTGKSTILPDILASLGFAPESVQFVAPTGKAAKVMRQKLRAQGYPTATAGTIHSAIYRAKPAPISQLEADLAAHEDELTELVMLHGGAKTHPDVLKQVKMCKRLKEELESAYREDKVHFQLNPDSPISLCKLIVCDESSMVGLTMAEDLMSFGVPILAIGDPGQLPPVEDKPGLLVGEPHAFLSEIHRQALDNPIIHLSQLARNDEDIPVGKYGDNVEVIRRKSYDPVIDFDTRPMFLLGMNKTRWRINQMLRHEFGFTDNPRARVGPQEGEPLIVCKNNKDNPNLVNGTECIATSSADIHKGESRIELSFECEEGVPYVGKPVFQGRFEEHFSRQVNGFTCTPAEAFRSRKRTIEMDWAYAITVHKSQGSQWDHVVLIDESSVFRKDSAKHLYTGITRAAETLKLLV